MGKTFFAAAALAALMLAPAAAEDLSIPEEPGTFTVPRPDARGIIADFGVRLKLSGKQEERISSAIQKQTREFDKIFKDYESAAAEEKKWRYRMNEHRYRLSLISRGIPDLIREYLDEEQRENFDNLLEERRKPVAEVKKAEAKPAEEKPAEIKPKAKKRVLVRRKKPAASKARPATAPAPAEETGQSEEEYEDLGSYP